MTLVAIAIVGGVPFAFVGRPLRTMFGLPTWLWSSILFTALLSILTAWGLLRYWRDDEHE